MNSSRSRRRAEIIQRLQSCGLMERGLILHLVLHSGCMCYVMLIYRLKTCNNIAELSLAMTSDPTATAHPHRGTQVVL
jgi:hypothetical protein